MKADKNFDGEIDFDEFIGFLALLKEAQSENYQNSRFIILLIGYRKL